MDLEEVTKLLEKKGKIELEDVNIAAERLELSG
jgi:hypothetical protein